MAANEVPPQPAVRSGEVIAAEGRWNEAALRRIHQLAEADLIWTEGALGFSISMGGIVIGRLNRRPRGQLGRQAFKGSSAGMSPLGSSSTGTTPQFGRCLL